MIWIKIKNLIIREANASENQIIAQHFYQLWLDNNIAPDFISENWLEITIEFITKAKSDLSFQSFVAIVDNQVIASTSCQLFTGLYPMLFKPDFRRYGYIWNVHVESNYRRQGIATQLTQKAINYLDSLNCTHAILHASPQGKSVYENLGFIPKNEMILELKNNNL